jgi:hypothetical protein
MSIDASSFYLQNMCLTGGREGMLPSIDFLYVVLLSMFQFYSMVSSFFLNRLSTNPHCFEFR